MEVLETVVSSKSGAVLVRVGENTYLTCSGSMHLAVCEKTGERFLVKGDLVAGMMMKDHKDFLKCIDWVRPEEIERAIQEGRSRPEPEKETPPVSGRKTYHVGVEYVYRASVSVEADSPEEAVNRILEMSNEGIVGAAQIDASSLEDGQPVNICDDNGEDYSEQCAL